MTFHIYRHFSFTDISVLPTFHFHWHFKFAKNSVLLTSRGLAERRLNSDTPASRQKFVVVPAFLVNYLFMYWEVWIMMIYWWYISRRHVSACEPWSLLYWWTTMSGRYYVVPDLNVKTETLPPLKKYSTGTGSGLSLISPSAPGAPAVHLPAGCLPTVHLPAAAQPSPPPPTPPWSLPTSAPPCTTLVVVRITLAWCHSLLELRISPSWLHMKVPSSTHLVNGFW